MRKGESVTVITGAVKSLAGNECCQVCSVHESMQVNKLHMQATDAVLVWSGKTTTGDVSRGGWFCCDRSKEANGAETLAQPKLFIIRKLLVMGCALLEQRSKR